MSNTTRTADYEMGRKNAQEEITSDNWSAETARAYLAALTDTAPINDFDRGFMDTIRALAAR